MKEYKHQNIENKWQKKWKEEGLHKTDLTDKSKKKYYLLDMFPYPSGSGLHMGHTEQSAITDTFYRYKKMKGFNVLHPQGFDSFGLPAENFAIKTKIHPVETIKKTSKVFKEQMENLGLGYDFMDGKVTTSDPEYYRWTQWLFGKFFENDIAYKKTAKANWCDSCKTVIATEQMENGKCERCDTEIEQKEIPSWMFRITDFADDLIWTDKNLNIDWPSHTKINQNNWIGKSSGAHIEFSVVESEYIDINRDGGADSYQDGVEEVERFNVVVVVESPDGSEFLCAKWKKVDWQGFVTGGIEDGDSVKQTAIKEVQEETGYQNVEVIKVYKKSSHGKFYHVGKKINRFAHYQIVHVKLTDLEKVDRSEEEKEIADMLWIKKTEVNDFLKREDMKYPWRVVNGKDLMNEKIKVFTTRPDTLFGVTYMVLAPEHSLVKTLKDKITNWDEVEKYISDTKKKTELERLESKKKTGVELKGLSSENPASGENVSVFISDYVLAGYGTGAIMAVPAHDERDNEFAKKFRIEIKEAVSEIDISTKLKDDVYRDATYGIILNNNKEILIQYHSGQKNYRLVGGGIDKGENKKQALIRKIIEETGYSDVKVQNQIETIYHKLFNKNIEKTVRGLKYFYVVDLLSEEKTIDSFEDDKKMIYQWISKNDLKKHLENNEYRAGDRVAIKNYLKNEIFSGNGILVNSGEFDGMKSEEAKEKITKFVGGEMTSTYRLRDWSISRQRYWGTPIPIVYSPTGEAKFVGAENLPWTLPTDVDFVPTGIAPLAQSKELVDRTEKIFGKGWTPEVDTMDTFVDSSWYFLRYCDSKNETEFSSAEAMKKWMPVDLYIGGAEHTYMHLLFARFFVKAMKKIGLLSFDEPFLKLRHQGMVKDINGKKMSKSKGNVVNPNDVIERFGADATRMYMLFSSPLEDDIAWNEDNIVGIYRFLEKVWRQQEKIFDKENEAILPQQTKKQVQKELHKTIKLVGEKIEDLRFNTAISDMMKFINFYDKEAKINKNDFENFIKILSPFAPHIAEEIFRNLGGDNFLIQKDWPNFDEELIIDNLIRMTVQVNGKKRGEIEISPSASENEVVEKTKENQEIQKWLESGVKKVVYIPGRILNFVV